MRRETYPRRIFVQPDDIPQASRRFVDCLNLTLDLWEVGPTKDGSTVDTGGHTRWGISARAFPEVDIASLTVGGAAALYHSQYWHPLGLDDLRSWRVAAKVFDIVVNLGPRQEGGRLTVGAGPKVAQRALAHVGRDVVVDGLFGPKTRAALNDLPQLEALNALCVEQSRHYSRLALRDGAKYGRYEGGWLARAAWWPRPTYVRP